MALMRQIPVRPLCGDREAGPQAPSGREGSSSRRGVKPRSISTTIVAVEKTYYSVPYNPDRDQFVDVRVYLSPWWKSMTAGRGVASHMRINKAGAYVTENLHMPREHRQYLEWTPERIKEMGSKDRSPYKKSSWTR